MDEADPAVNSKTGLHSDVVLYRRRLWAALIIGTVALALAAIVGMITDGPANFDNTGNIVASLFIMLMLGIGFICFVGFVPSLIKKAAPPK